MAQMASADPLFVEKARIVAHATDSLNGRENAMAWLERPNRDFDGRTPLDVLNSGDPAELKLLNDILTALDYGMHI